MIYAYTEHTDIIFNAVSEDKKYYYDGMGIKYDKEFVVFAEEDEIKEFLDTQREIGNPICAISKPKKRKR